jgi:hypothetical protein
VLESSHVPRISRGFMKQLEGRREQSRKMPSATE